MPESIQLTCPKCGRIFRASPEHHESTANCPHCDNRVVVPHVAAEESDPFDDLFELESEQADPADRDTANDAPSIPVSDSEAEFQFKADVQGDVTHKDDATLPVHAKSENEKSEIKESKSADDSAAKSLLFDDDDLLLGNVTSPKFDSQKTPSKTDDPYLYDNTSPIVIDGLSLSTKAEGTFTFACPFCDSLLHATPNQIGSSIRCEDCHSSVEVRRPAEATKAKKHSDQSKSEATGQSVFRREELDLFDSDTSEFTTDGSSDNVETGGYTLRALDDEGTGSNLPDTLEIIDDEEAGSIERTDPSPKQLGNAGPAHGTRETAKSASDDQSAHGLPMDVNPVASYTPRPKPVPRQKQESEETKSDSKSAERQGEINPERSKLPGGPDSLENRSHVLQSVVIVFRNGTTWFFTAAIGLLLAFGYGLCFWGANTAMGTEGASAVFAMLVVFVGIVFLVAATLATSAFGKLLIDAARKGDESPAELSKIEFGSLLPNGWKPSVALAAALGPGLFLGIVFFAMTTYLTMIPICSIATLFTLFPFFYVAASYNISPYQIFAPKIIESVQLYKNAWINIYLIIGIACLVSIFVVILNAFFAVWPFALFVAMIHAVSLTLLLRATGILNRAIMVIFER